MRSQLGRQTAVGKALNFNFVKRVFVVALKDMDLNRASEILPGLLDFTNLLYFLSTYRLTENTKDVHQGFTSATKIIDHFNIVKMNNM